MPFFAGSAATLPGLRTSEYLQAFESAALPHRDQVYRTARYLVRDAFWASDLTQEVFLQAWKSFDRFQPGTNCKAWLLAILFHTCQHHRRSLGRNQTVALGPEHEDLIASQPSQQEPMDPALSRALQSLPAWYKSVLILAEVYEYSYHEISTMLGVPIGTVMSRLSRARKQLRVRLLKAAIPMTELRQTAAAP